MSGFFITFEGGEGVGKTTQTQLVASALREKGYNVITTREPGGTPLGEKIREILLKGEVDKMEPMTEALLFTAVRYNHYIRVIKPALERGDIVICDRFCDTTFAYQGLAHGLGLEKMEKLYRLALDDFKPNLTIIFDLPNGSSHGRLTEMNRFENMGDAWLLKGAEGFREVARLHRNRCVLMPSTGSIEEVTSRIMDIIKERLGL